jgi:hypothetical protein
MQPAACQDLLIEVMDFRIAAADAGAVVWTFRTQHITRALQPDHRVGIECKQKTVHIGGEVCTVALSLKESDAERVMRPQLKD